MDASTLFDNRQPTYIYLERYVNDGSPSGFTESKTTSQATSPFKGVDMFRLLEFNDHDIECITLGSKHPLFERGVNYAHPDSMSSSILLGAGRTLAKTRFDASPTASGRTMLIRTPPPEGYLKLTYDTTRIGRIDRQLTLKLCQSSLEVAHTLQHCIDDHKLPSSFALLLE